MFAVTHLSGEKEFPFLLEKVEPIWLGVAFLLQAGWDAARCGRFGGAGGPGDG